MTQILEIKGLNKRYGSIQAVNNLNLSVKKGSVFGLLGPNGSGKTTTLAMLLGVIKPQSGTFTLFGEPASADARKKIGAILEQPIFYPQMSAVENLKVVCKIKSVDYSEIDRVLKWVNLDERKQHAFKGYSLGMKQRLAIASALLNNPEILILDEPTNGLDPQGIHEIREIIQNIAKNGTTILLASHLLDEVEKVCSHVVVIREGVKLYSGRVDEMSASHGLFELNTNEPKNKLISILNNNSNIGSVKEEGDLIVAHLTTEMEASEINNYLFKNGITVSHLVKRKPSLEEQFLDLTNTN